MFSNEIGFSRGISVLVARRMAFQAERGRQRGRISFQGVPGRILERVVGRAAAMARRKR